MSLLQLYYLVTGIVIAIIWIIVRTVVYKHELETVVDLYNRDRMYMTYVIDVVGGTFVTGLFGPLVLATGIFTIVVALALSPIILVVIILTS